MKRPPAHAGGRLAWAEPLSLVAGTGFETATSGLLSYVPGVSRCTQCFKSAGQRAPRVPPVAARRTGLGQLRGVLFPNPFPNEAVACGLRAVPTSTSVRAHAATSTAAALPIPPSPNHRYSHPVATS